MNSNLMISPISMFPVRKKHVVITGKIKGIFQPMVSLFDANTDANNLRSFIIYYLIIF